MYGPVQPATPPAHCTNASHLVSMKLLNRRFAIPNTMEKIDLVCVCRLCGTNSRQPVNHTTSSFHHMRLPLTRNQLPTTSTPPSRSQVDRGISPKKSEPKPAASLAALVAPHGSHRFIVCACVAAWSPQRAVCHHTWSPLQAGCHLYDTARFQF